MLKANPVGIVNEGVHLAGRRWQRAAGVATHGNSGVVDHELIGAPFTTRRRIFHGRRATGGGGERDECKSGDRQR
jgi:hypothetical protein